MSGRVPVGPTAGLIVLQEDETVEDDLRQLLPSSLRLLASRVASGADVTSETLSAMQADMGRAAGLFPRGLQFDVVAYACTSGAAEIGPARVAETLGNHVITKATTDPLTSLVRACRQRGVTRLALLSPYIASVSERLIEALGVNGIEIGKMVTFDEASEEQVVRIPPERTEAAAVELGRDPRAEAIFISCTNLRALPVLSAVARQTGLPVWSSNLVLAWDMAVRSGTLDEASPPEALLPS